MRYNLEYHSKADAVAQEHGYDFAVYMGHYKYAGKDRLVFLPHYCDFEQYKEGKLNYMLVDEKHVLWKSELNFSKPFLEYDYLKKGRQLFRELEAKVKSDSFDTEEERDYSRELYFATQVGYDIPIYWRDLALFLQEAHRMNRKIEFVPDESTTDRLDGWRYIVRFK